MSGPQRKIFSSSNRELLPTNFVVGFSTEPSILYTEENVAIAGRANWLEVDSDSVPNPEPGRCLPELLKGRLQLQHVTTLSDDGGQRAIITITVTRLIPPDCVQLEQGAYCSVDVVLF